MQGVSCPRTPTAFHFVDDLFPLRLSKRSPCLMRELSILQVSLTPELQDPHLTLQLNIAIINCCCYHCCKSYYYIHKYQYTVIIYSCISLFYPIVLISLLSNPPAEADVPTNPPPRLLWELLGFSTMFMPHKYIRI